MLIKNRPRRSVLYMPASNPRALEKAKELPADSVICDLEDAVAPTAKAGAREAAIAATCSGSYGHRECLIRVNSLDTPWGQEDLQAVAKSEADGVLIPKVSSPTELQAVDSVLTRYGASAELPIWVMMETASGILAADAIAKSSNRLVGYCAGTADLAKDLQCAHPADRGTMLIALQNIILVARAHALIALDGVHVDLKDEAGFALACAQGRDFGFDGKTLVHPKQITVANETFSPSVEELVYARRLIAAHQDAQGKGTGVITLDGKIIEVLHVQQAKQLISRAESIAAINDQIGI